MAFPVWWIKLRSEPRHGYGWQHFSAHRSDRDLDGRSHPGVAGENADGDFAADDLLGDGHDVGGEEVLGGAEIPAEEALEPGRVGFPGGSKVEALDEDDGSIVAVEQGLVDEGVPLVIGTEIMPGFDGDGDVEAERVEGAANHLLGKVLGALNLKRRHVSEGGIRPGIYALDVMSGIKAERWGVI